MLEGIVGRDFLPRGTFIMYIIMYTVIIIIIIIMPLLDLIKYISKFTGVL